MVSASPRRTLRMVPPRNCDQTVPSLPKKRRYVPGGPGGGGRYIDIENDRSKASNSKNAKINSSPKDRPQREHSSHREPSTRNASSPVRPVRSTPPAPTRTRRDRERSARDKDRNGNRRYSSAAAAALAVFQADGDKPREECGWEEFHPDLDIDKKMAVFSAEIVDGTDVSQYRGDNVNGSLSHIVSDGTDDITSKQPPTKNDEALPMVPMKDIPKLVQPSSLNPGEKLTLPKPAFILKDPFSPFEQKGVGQENYVDRTMASAGYQESDIFLRHERRLIRITEGSVEEDLDLDPITVEKVDANVAIGSAGAGRVEYDMDEHDACWLEAYNVRRRESQSEPIKPAIFEITMTKIEKEWHALEKRIPKPNPKPPQTQRPRSSSAAAVNGEHCSSGEEQDTKCAICDDGDCENANAIVFCDGCDLAVHQECYGVPYIPEGQWLCRKCQLLGHGSPNCIFCPNTEGAFKQTNSSKWSHLVCALWIPEVSIGNTSLMEPVIEVEKVPKGRWKLNCYICRQKMGACIQCSNKNCFVAFHVTCGRRGGLYLKMKNSSGASAVTDPSGLKAFCDKHVPPDWRMERNTDNAIIDAIDYYKTTMAGRRWGDSQAAALALGPDVDDEAGEEQVQSYPQRLTLTVGGNKRKRPSAPRLVWKLPSGAPVVPQIILDRVITSLQRFTVRHRKQYAEDACKYWTLKREARRGAALVKRLQLQLETFSSMEMTRRNFAGMGVAGALRLQRRIGFAERLYTDLDRVRILCDEVKKREHDKLKDVGMLQNVVDVVYFPIPPLLWPIFEKAASLDGKNMFRTGFSDIREKLESRKYTSVSEFSRDLANVFTNAIGVDSVMDTAHLLIRIDGRAPELSVEQRERRKYAKRIVKTIQPALEDSLIKESELNGKPFERELEDLDLLLGSSVLSRKNSNTPAEEDKEATEKISHKYALPPADDVEMTEDDVSLKTDADAQCHSIPARTQNVDQKVSGREKMVQTSIDTGMELDPPPNSPPHVPAAISNAHENGAPTPVDDAHDGSNSLASVVIPTNQDQNPLSQGGIRWYMQPFDPVGTTIHEERWTGRDVVRGMSEELSELDEENLREFVEDELSGNAKTTTEAIQPGASRSISESAPKTRKDKPSSTTTETKVVHRTRKQKGLR